MPAVIDLLIPAAVGAIVSFVGSVLTLALESRRKIDESLRERREADYLKLWGLTSAVPKWPRATLTTDGLKHLTTELKNWYFAGGGMYLSAASQHAYKNVQENIVTVLDATGADVTVNDTSYDRIHQACSLLRTSLTNDLLSRSRTVWTRSIFS